MHPPNDAIDSFLEAIRFFDAQGWTPATSSNFSYRLGTQAFAISASGLEKGRLTAHDFLACDLSTLTPLQEGERRKPSAEALLHATVYQQYPEIGYVVHTHSTPCTILSKLYEPQGTLRLTGFELLKGLQGVTTHEAQVCLPIFPNHQDMTVIQPQLHLAMAQTHQAHLPLYGFILAGHGLYTWGRTPQEAKRHLEVFETLVMCTLELKKHGYFNAI
ncbi:MAG: methylthioribulose 1-phosphate dehydratase [Vampirovibrionales bacterium]